MGNHRLVVGTFQTRKINITYNRSDGVRPTDMWRKPVSGWVLCTRYDSRDLVLCTRSVFVFSKAYCGRMDGKVMPVIMNRRE